jgi:hypothetical protein
MSLTAQPEAVVNLLEKRLGSRASSKAFPLGVTIAQSFEVNCPRP